MRSPCFLCLPVVLAALAPMLGCSSSDTDTAAGGAASTGTLGATSQGNTSANGSTAGSMSSPSSSGSGNASSGSNGSTGAGGTAGCGTAGAATGDLHLHANDGNGTARDYELLVPDGYDPATPLALTFVYHGAGGNESSSKGFGIQNAPGAADASIFVFPKGIQFQNYGIGWDDSCGGYDMPFFDAMLESIESTYCIDPARVFVAGFSWGGDQTTALTCCRGDILRAVAPASCTDEFGDAAQYDSYSNLPCPVANHAAIRFTHDANGDSAYPNPLFATTSELFRSFNGCNDSSTATSPSPCASYDGCSNAYVECPYDGLGHALPGGYGDDTWSFFASF